MNSSEKIGLLKESMLHIKAEIDAINDLEFHIKYKDMTIEEVRKKWDESDSMERWEMIGDMPGLNDAIDSVAEWRNCHKNEVMDDLGDNYWGDQSYISVSKLFGKYCRLSEKKR